MFNLCERDTNFCSAVFAYLRFVKGVVNVLSSLSRENGIGNYFVCFNFHGDSNECSMYVPTYFQITKSRKKTGRVSLVPTYFIAVTYIKIPDSSHKKEIREKYYGSPKDERSINQVFLPSSRGIARENKISFINHCMDILPQFPHTCENAV